MESLPVHRRMTARMWAVTILALLGMGVALSGILRVFSGSYLLPLALLATAGVIIGSLAEWLMIEAKRDRE
jgi:zinc transporter ZupT